MTNTGVMAAGARGWIAGLFGLAAFFAAAIFFSGAAVAAGQLSVVMSVEVNAPVAQVWKTVRAFDRLQDWHPAVESTTMQGSPEQVGAVRILHLNGGGEIHERLTYLSDSSTTLTYQILESPLPIDNYHSYLSASDAGNGRTVVIWGSTFDAKGASDAKAKEVISGIYQAGFDKLKELFGG